MSNYGVSFVFPVCECYSFPAVEESGGPQWTMDDKINPREVDNWQRSRNRMEPVVLNSYWIFSYLFLIPLSHNTQASIAMPGPKPGAMANPQSSLHGFGSR
jgi:hypothetical protein